MLFNLFNVFFILLHFFQKLTYLNQSDILDPIDHLLPVKLPTLSMTNSSSERIKKDSFQDNDKDNIAEETLIDL